MRFAEFIDHILPHLFCRLQLGVGFAYCAPKKCAGDRFRPAIQQLPIFMYNSIAALQIFLTNNIRALGRLHSNGCGRNDGAAGRTRDPIALDVHEGVGPSRYVRLCRARSHQTG